MTTTTQGEHAQTESLRPIQRFNNIAGLMNPESRGLYVRYEDHAAQVAALTAAPQGGAYADWAQLRSALAMLMLGWGRNPSQNMEACNTVLDSATEPGMPLALLRSAPDWRTHALRASNGQAPAGAAPVQGFHLFNAYRATLLEMRKERPHWRHAGLPVDDWFQLTAGEQMAFDAAAKLIPTAQAAPAAGAVAGPSVRKVFLVATGEEHEGEATYTRYDDAPPPLCDSECLYTAAPTPAAQVDALTQAARDVLAERQRQISAEGWTPEHDDDHSFGQLARAGAAYAAQSLCAEDAELECEPPKWWPWDRAWWKPNSRRGMLVKAGALILAEMERLDRAADRASRAQPDSVLEDAARWQFVESAPSAITLRLHNLRPDQRAQYVDAARKQGGKHD